MPAITGVAASVTWTNNTNLIGEAGDDSRPMKFTLNTNGPAVDATPFGTTTGMEYAQGLRDWSGSIECRAHTATIGGASGGFALSSGYQTNPIGWTLDITAQEHDTTPLSPSSFWRTFIPGLVSWGGSADFYYDDSAAVGAIGGTDSIVLTLRTSNTFAGSVFVAPAQTLSVGVNELNRLTQAFTGTGALTAAGTNNFFAAGAIATPTAGTLVLTSSASQTFTGSAFWTGVSISCPVDGLVTATVNFRGSGALTIA